MPTISGATIGWLSRGPSAAELLAVGTLGLVATPGILVYELRNTQVYDYALHRARELEARLGLVAVVGPHKTGGLFRERPGSLRLGGLRAAGGDRGLALVYSAAIGGAAALLVLVEFLRLDRRARLAECEEIEIVVFARTSAAAPSRSQLSPITAKR